MSRPLRIEYPDAWHHVMNRGRRAEKIFSNKTDYTTFLELLMESAEMWKVRIAAYCMVPNHYHLLLQTPDANLSRFMRHLDGVYTQRFNRSYHYDGQLFRGRYKSILVDADSYLLQLVRYIHRNPLQAGVATKIEGYKWSSHQGYLSGTKTWNWLYKGFILSMLTKDKRQQLRAYKQFMAKEDSEEICQVFEGKKLPSTLGSKKFIDRVKDRFFHQKSHEEIPESRKLAPAREKIKQVVCKAYHVREEDLLKSKKGIVNESRDVAIYLTRRLRGEGLDKICKEFHMTRHSSASSVVHKVSAQISKDKRFRKRVEELRLILAKRQT